MLHSLNKVGQDMGQGVSRAWNRFADGWRELWSRAGGALTRFRRNDDEAQERVAAPRRGLLAGEAWDNDAEIVVRLEVPGLERGDIQVAVLGDWLRVSGEKRHDRAERWGHYYLRERAYGRFERVIPLPEDVDAGRARATCRNGVLTVRLPKAGRARARRVTVH